MRLDPRVAIGCCLVYNFVVLSVGGRAVEVIAVGLLVLTLLMHRRLVAAGVFLVGEVALRWASTSSLHSVGVLATAGTFTMRCALVGAMTVCLVGALSTGQFLAATGWARLPTAVVVPLVVALRFVPTVTDDARALRDTLRVRRLLGAREVLRSPGRLLGLFVAPLVVSSLRSGEDLSASALLRGLGSDGPRTSLSALRCNTIDLAATVGAAALLGLGVASWLTR